ncbi:MAG: putative zinc-binding protein [Bacteroidales bacterium]|nr:putative zinc-binding protein [Bacteroidales bacterium]
MDNQELNAMLVSCSGASNTGCYADKVARMLAESGRANMICLPKIAINDEKLINQVKNTGKKVIVIDGCPINCAEKIMKDHGIDNFSHINTTDFGIIKGKTPITEENLNKIIKHIEKIAS